MIELEDTIIENPDDWVIGVRNIAVVLSGRGSPGEAYHHIEAGHIKAYHHWPYGHAYKIKYVVARRSDIQAYLATRTD